MHNAYNAYAYASGQRYNTTDRPTAHLKNSARSGNDWGVPRKEVGPQDMCSYDLETGKRILSTGTRIILSAIAGSRLRLPNKISPD